MMFKSLYGARERVTTTQLDSDGNPLPSLTHQSFKDECDVYKIIRKYDRTGLLSHVNTAKALYGDYTTVNEYRESLHIVLAASEAYDSLPAALRRRFIDPGEFMEFVTNPANHEECVSLGLANPKQSDQPSLDVTGLTDTKFELGVPNTTKQEL